MSFRNFEIPPIEITGENFTEPIPGPYNCGEIYIILKEQNILSNWWIACKFCEEQFEYKSFEEFFNHVMLMHFDKAVSGPLEKDLENIFIDEETLDNERKKEPIEELDDEVQIIDSYAIQPVNETQINHKVLEEDQMTREEILKQADSKAALLRSKIFNENPALSDKLILKCDQYLERKCETESHSIIEGSETDQILKDDLLKLKNREAAKLRRKRIKENPILSEKLKLKEHANYLKRKCFAKRLSGNEIDETGVEEKEFNQMQSVEANHSIQTNDEQRYISMCPSLKDEENQLVANLLRNGSSTILDFVEFNHEIFETLHSLIQHKTSKRKHHRNAIPSRLKLAITLRFLITGETYAALEFLTNVSKPTISIFMPHMTNAIYTCLENPYLQPPSTPDEWKAFAEEFSCIHNIPNVLAILDGKCIDVIRRLNTSTDFINRNGKISVILLTLMDAKGNFLLVDIEAQKQSSSNGVFKNSTLFKTIFENTLNFPISRPLPGRNKPVPFVMIGNDGFALSERVLTKYSTTAMTGKQYVFNLSLSHCQNVSKSSFGTLAARFRILMQPIHLKLDVVESVILACCTLHNFLNKHDHSYTSMHPEQLQNIDHEEINCFSKEALENQNEFAEYFSNEVIKSKKSNVFK